MGEHVDVPLHGLPTEVLPRPDDRPQQLQPFQRVPRRPSNCNGGGRIPLGDHDTKEDGTRLAVEAAKRHALEQVVTYVESVTTATALDLTRDEIRTYTISSYYSACSLDRLLHRSFALQLHRRRLPCPRDMALIPRQCLAHQPTLPLPRPLPPRFFGHQPTSRLPPSLHQIPWLALLFATLGIVHAEDSPPAMSSIPLDEPYIIGMGQGDLSKGRLVCERVAELAARADVAKQIRVLVKEEIRDRVREQTGRTVEQDIEIVREEHVSELLKRVRIVERNVDAATGICTSKALMQKHDMPHTR